MTGSLAKAVVQNVRQQFMYSRASSSYPVLHPSLQIQSPGDRSEFYNVGQNSALRLKIPTH